MLTSSDKYPEREKSDECTTQVRINAADLAERVSRLLDELGIVRSVSSGFRTATANASGNGRPLSAHLTGEACDIEDKDGKLACAILRDRTVLERHNLYCEDFNYTSTWVHFTTRRPKSGNRVFIP